MPQPSRPSSTPSSPALLGQSLAQLLQRRRHERGDSLETLAERSELSVSTLEDLEEGKLTFLSQVQRSRLARALKLEAADIAALERWIPHNSEADALAHLDNPAYFSDSPFLKHLPLLEMLRNPDGFWPCPSCGGGLVTRSYYRETLEGFPLNDVKIHCTHCLFRHQQELPHDSVSP